ncbi:MAG TPA: hypothetical protein RMG48_21235 [Myxococcales bacterium LLY-WYZ-16_1]|nr:hypothetical protein [Myxococcales bacterium LLY-WYZ-16_1]
MSAAIPPKVQAQARTLLMQLYMVVRTFRVHDANNRALLVATENLRDTINTLWASLDGRLQLQLVDGVAYVNDFRVRMDASLKEQVDALHAEFVARQLGGLAFSRPVDALALKDFLHTLSRPVDSDEEIAQLKSNLLEFRSLAMELLDPKSFAEVGDESHEEVRVDRKTFALQSYAKAVVAVRDWVEALRAGEDARSSRLNLTRVVQDLVDIGTDRINFLLKLSAIKQPDYYAYSHAANTCMLSLVMGRALGVDRVRLVDLGMSGLFADIGFALLPAELIDRERELSDREKSEVQTAMVQQIRGLFRGHRITDSMMRRVIVAYEHHLAFRDPRTGESESLHPYSRIVAVADAFDALTTRRPWRDGYAADEALKILSKEAGTRFDPRIVRLLTNLVGVYPLGTGVRLSNGETAVVYHSPADPSLHDRPWVRIVKDARGEVVRRTAIKDLSREDVRIVAALPPGEFPVDPGSMAWDVL